MDSIAKLRVNIKQNLERIEVILIGSGNWIVDNLNSALETWNGKLMEIW